MGGEECVCVCLCVFVCGCVWVCVCVEHCGGYFLPSAPPTAAFSSGALRPPDPNAPRVAAIAKAFFFQPWPHGTPPETRPRYPHRIATWWLTACEGCPAERRPIRYQSEQLLPLCSVRERMPAKTEREQQQQGENRQRRHRWWVGVGMCVCVGGWVWVWVCVCMSMCVWVAVGWVWVGGRMCSCRLHRSPLQEQW